MGGTDGRTNEQTDIRITIYPRKFVWGGYKNNGFNMFLYLSTYQGPSNGYAPRFLGFSLYISNTTDKSDGTLCFKDTNFTLSTIPAVFNITCTVHGHYVIYYNERLEGVTYPDGYSAYAYNGLCEVEVYGNSMLNFSSLNQIVQVTFCGQSLSIP